MEILKTYAVALLLAFGIEFAIESYVVPWFSWVPWDSIWRNGLKVLSLGTSVGLALFYHLDAPSLLLEAAPTQIGMVFTGIIIGGGVDVVHTAFRKYVLEKPIA